MEAEARTNRGNKKYQSGDKKNRKQGNCTKIENAFLGFLLLKCECERHIQHNNNESYIDEGDLT